MKPSRAFAFTLAASLLSGSAIGLVTLHLDNSRLTRRVAELSAQKHETVQLRDENLRLKELIEHHERNEGEAASAVHAALIQARAEATGLEQRAQRRHAEKKARADSDAAALATNRDPRQGFTRLEHFQNRGRTTPAAAMETLVWAALKGDEATLAATCTFTRDTRRQAEGLIARIPLEARSRWTPEKLAALWAMDISNDLPALHFTDETLKSADEATVTFRAPGIDDPGHLNLKLTPSGWKVILPSNAMEKLEKKLGSVAVSGP
jgi:hypothetical protein